MVLVWVFICSGLSLSVPSLLNNWSRSEPVRDVLSASAHLGEIRLKGVQDTPGICQGETLFYKLTEMPPMTGTHLLKVKHCSWRRGRKFYPETNTIKCWQEL